MFLNSQKIFPEIDLGDIVLREKQDSDIDNSKMFVTRSIKAQRKLKIIDND